MFVVLIEGAEHQHAKVLPSAWVRYSQIADFVCHVLPVHRSEHD